MVTYLVALHRVSREGRHGAGSPSLGLLLGGSGPLFDVDGSSLMWATS